MKITPFEIYRFFNKERGDFALWAGNYKDSCEKLADFINYKNNTKKEKQNVR